MLLRLIAILFGLAAFVRAEGPNLVPNGDFSLKLEGWQIRFPEANEQNYARNHQWVTLAPAPGDAPPNSQALVFTLSPAVAAVEGVKAVTGLIPIEDVAGAVYAFGADIWRDRPSLIVFLEGYQRDPEQKVAGSDQYPGYVRVFRATIHVKAKANAWATVSREITLPEKERYRPSHVLIKLYAYHPAGQAAFRNVFLRRIK